MPYAVVVREVSNNVVDVQVLIPAVPVATYMYMYVLCNYVYNFLLLGFSSSGKLSGQFSQSLLLWACTAEMGSSQPHKLILQACLSPV